MSSSASSVSMAKTSTSDRAKVKVMALRDIQEMYARDGKIDLSKVKNEEKLTVRKYPFFVVPAHEMTPKIFFEQLVALRKNGRPVVGIGPSLALPFDRKKTFTFNQMPIMHKVDQDMYRRFVNSSVPAVLQCVDIMEQMVRCNGSLQGLAKRMLSKMCVAPEGNQLRPSVSKVTKRLFVDMDYVKKMDMPPTSAAASSSSSPAASITSPTHYQIISETLHSECYVLSKLNVSADAGFPYAFECSGQQVMKKMTDTTNLKIQWFSDEQLSHERVNVPLGDEMLVIDHAVAYARKFMREYLDGDLEENSFKISALKRCAPELWTAILKRKDERIERNEYLEKVRPYGVYPLPIRLVMMHGLAPIEIGLVNYQDNPESCSAYHTSPFYGSAEKFVLYVLYHRDKFVKGKMKYYFHGICYGDDQLWFFHFDDGFIVFGPDIGAMDMSTHNKGLPHYINWILNNTKGVGPIQINCAILSALMTFNSYLHVGGSYIVVKSNSVLSGIPGTTIKNIHSSAEVMTTVEDEFVSYFVRNEDKCTVKNGLKFLSAILKKITAKYNYVFKDCEFSTEGDFVGKAPYQIFNSVEQFQTEGCRVPFLSQVLVVDHGHYLFLPKDITPIVAGLILPGNHKNAGGKTLERILGVYITGGWYIKEYREFLVKCFNDKKDEKADDGQLDVEELYHGADDAQDLVDVFGLTKCHSLPSYEVMFDFCTLSKEVFFDKYHKKGLVEKDVAKPSANDSEPIDDDFFSSTLKAAKELSRSATVPLKSAGQGNATNSDDAAILRERAKEREKKKLAKETVMSIILRGREEQRHARILRGQGVRTTDYTKDELLTFSKVVEEAAAVDEEVARHLKQFMDEEEYLRSLEDEAWDIDDEDREAEFNSKYKSALEKVMDSL